MAIDRIHDYIVPGKRAHLVGIGGVSMSPLAEVLQGEGLIITGSDVKESPAVDRLRALGIPVTIGHLPESVAGKDLVIRTAAVHDSNPEIAAAHAAGNDHPSAVVRQEIGQEAGTVPRVGHRIHPCDPAVGGVEEDEVFTVAEVAGDVFPHGCNCDFHSKDSFFVLILFQRAGIEISCPEPQQPAYHLKDAVHRVPGRAHIPLVDAYRHLFSSKNLTPLARTSVG